MFTLFNNYMHMYSNGGRVRCRGFRCRGFDWRIVILQYFSLYVNFLTENRFLITKRSRKVHSRRLFLTEQFVPCVIKRNVCAWLMCVNYLRKLRAILCESLLNLSNNRLLSIVIVYSIDNVYLIGLFSDPSDRG